MVIIGTLHTSGSNAVEITNQSLPNASLVLVRYGEITLKDRWTRSSWERILQANISQVLREANIDFHMTRDGGRIYIHTTDPCAASLAANVFGVVSSSPAKAIAPRMEDIIASAVETANTFKPKTFAIRARRSGGSLSSESLAINVGKAVKDESGASVNLDHPELEIHLESRSDKVLLFTNVIKGVGGLPIGSQSRMLTLISGGIDSPVAAWSMMRRGCSMSLLHFDAQPYADSRNQTLQSAKVLRRWTSGRAINFWTVENKEGIDLFIKKYPRTTCILCRRLMYRVAAEVMKRDDAVGIVTGYSLGQVASQTPENIMAEQVGIEAPIYHPLISMDKTDITDLARRIGTFGICKETKSCTAVPNKPKTKAKLDEIRAIEEDLDLKALASKLASEAYLERI